MTADTTTDRRRRASPERVRRWARTADERASETGADIRMSGLLVLGLGVAVAGLHSLLADTGWWFGSVAIAAIILGCAALVRYFFRPRWLPSVAGLVAGLIVVTASFAPGTAIAGFVPTPATFARFGDLVAMANDSIARQSVPAFSVEGIQFLVCGAIAGIAVIMDVTAIWWRAPALTGIPLLTIVLVPSLVRPELSDAVFFELTAVAYLFIIRVRIRRVQPAVGLVIGVIAVLGALIVPAALPPVTGSTTSATGIGGIVESVNPIIDLGDDLRRSSPISALTYTTTATTGEYLRLTTLESFAGKEWLPVAPRPIKGHTVAKIAAPPGLATAVKRKTVETTVHVNDTSGQWLPVPYPSKSITGLSGSWYWEPKALAVLTTDSNMQGQTYVVKSLDIEPTEQQLESAPSDSSSPLAAVPKGLDPIVAATAKSVVGNAQTDFDKAVALQNWFRGGTFRYSTHTPASSGFDGSGLDVIVPFLKAKSGYCIHFATTMAVMARTLGIPSRIAVGFLPGTATHAKGEDATVYQVSSDDLHAWPELYFKGVGWVRFEPTPSKGFEPSFRSVQDNLPDAVPTAASTQGSTPTPTAGAGNLARLPGEQNSATGNIIAVSPAASVNWWLVALGAIIALLLTPAVARVLLRRRRLTLVKHGAGGSSLAWEELRDSARDLGLDARSSDTPRELAERLASALRASPIANSAMAGAALAALESLRDRVEHDSYMFAPPAEQVSTDSEDVAATVRGLRRASTTAVRLRAIFLPVTIIDRVMGRAAARA